MVTDPDHITALSITFDSEDERDMMSAYLDMLGAEAVEEQEGRLVLYHDQQKVLVDMLSELEQLVPFVKGRSSWDQVAQQNWNQIWENSFQPIIIDDFCAVRASFHEATFSVRHIITINPEMAFGTGHHETTYSMMQTMRSMDFKDKRIFDFGTGTGILAILAEKMGASEVLAIDFDPVAIDCAKDCLSLNNVHHVRTAVETIDTVNEEPFDIILANVNRNVLLQHIPDITRLAKEGTALLLSGIMEGDEEMVVKAYSESRWRVDDILRRGEWLCIRLTRS